MSQIFADVHREAALRGANLLDQRYPFDDWRGLIDRDRLAMGSTARCILGQLYGHYYRGLRALDPASSITGSFFGFDSYYGDYDSLNEAWLAELDRKPVPA